MSVIVRGMKMPKVCLDDGWRGVCPMDRLWCAQEFAPKGLTGGEIYNQQDGKLPSWCPLRPYEGPEEDDPP